MPRGNNPIAFADVREIFDRALREPGGVRVTLESDGHAINAVQRLNTLRVIDRRQNSETYPKDHPMHGTSIYDTLVISKDGPVIEIRKGVLKIVSIEPIHDELFSPAEEVGPFDEPSIE